MVTQAIYRLPDVPATAVALIGITSHRRWDRKGHLWVRSDVATRDAFPIPLGEVLEIEQPHGVISVDRLPRHWPQYDLGVTEYPTVVDVEGHGRWLRRESDGLYVVAEGGGTTRYRAPRTLSALAVLGDVTEVLGVEAHPA